MEKNEEGPKIISQFCPSRKNATVFSATACDNESFILWVKDCSLKKSSSDYGDDNGDVVVMKMQTTLMMCSDSDSCDNGDDDVMIMMMQMTLIMCSDSSYYGGYGNDDGEVIKMMQTTLIMCSDSSDYGDYGNDDGEVIMMMLTP